MRVCAHGSAPRFRRGEYTSWRAATRAGEQIALESSTKIDRRTPRYAAIVLRSATRKSKFQRAAPAWGGEPCSTPGISLRAGFYLHGAAARAISKGCAKNQAPTMAPVKCYACGRRVLCHTARTGAVALDDQAYSWCVRMDRPGIRAGRRRLRQGRGRRWHADALLCVLRLPPTGLPRRRRGGWA